MSKKRRNRHKKEAQEPQFDFDEAKELTVGQAIRKNEEVEAGVLPEDSILDKYVKQHRDEIEADKFATRQYKKEEFVETQSLDDLIQEMREAVEKSEASSEEVPSSEDILLPLPLDDEEQGLDPLLLDDENPTEMTEEVEEEQNLSRLDQEDSEKKSKKGFILTVLALVSVII
ncbi:mid-cell-anchored protein MapZ, partial [Streptococcus pneumoniae]|nr:mid-cell-anchored protein MapZ [Streptococcus pneumoniae]